MTIIFGKSLKAQRAVVFKKKFSADSLYWDNAVSASARYHLEQNVGIYKKSQHLRLIREWGGILKGKSILKTDLYEEALGNDGFLGWLRSQGAFAWGMDISPRITAMARRALNKKYPFFEPCVVSDIRRCAFKDGFFDLIISNSTLDNIRSEDVATALKELWRILKPGGVLILTLDNACNPLYRLGYFIRKALNIGRYYQDRCYTLSEARDLAKENGFVVMDETAIVHIPTPFNKIALLLERCHWRFLQDWIRSSVVLCSKVLAVENKKFLTGWFIALKLVKE